MATVESDRTRPAGRLWEQETDLFSAIFRTAFILAFAWAPLYLPVEWRIPPFVRLILIVAVLFTTLVFTCFATRRDVHWQRPFSLALDLVLVSAALYTVGPGAWAGLFQVYYLIVLQGAIWYRVSGALITALGATFAYGLVQLTLNPSDFMAMEFWVTHTAGIPFLLIIALVGGYLVASRDHEHQEAMRMRHEMLLARTLQDVMLPPHPPEIEGWRVALRLEPAREVGGDLYILEPLASGDYLVCLGDISGKSIYGLIYLSLILSHTRAAARQGLAPQAIAHQVNAHIFDTLAPETYAALFIGLLNPYTGTLTFVNCGHPPPLLISLEPAEIQALSGGGMVIGALREAEYVEQSVTIGPGDTWVAYTDGLSEARNKQGEEFGEQRLGTTALTILQPGSDAETLVLRLLEVAQNWSADPGADDATCLILQRLKSSEQD